MGEHRDAKPALFLDRDGVINVDSGYPYRAEDIVFIDGILDFCRRAQAIDLSLIIATNQAGIGRGFYTADQFWSLMDWMKRRFAEEGVNFTDVYQCPYHPMGIGEYRRASEDRKPAPGMLLRAIRDHRLDGARSYLIGDRESDMAAGVAAGLAGNILFAPTAASTDPRGTNSAADVAVATLSDAAEWLEHRTWARNHTRVGSRR